MEGKIGQVMSYEVLKEILNEATPVEDVVMTLFAKGDELAHVVTARKFDSLAHLRTEHNADNSELVELEGSSAFSDTDIVVLKNCPMAPIMKQFKVDGKAPAFHAQIVHDYKEQNPGSNAILHPGCIAHQVSRQIAVKDMNVAGASNLNFCELACRNMMTGDVVYDENGLEEIGMSKEQAYQLVDGFACLYAIKHS
jgi:hypothetical protein